MKINQILKIESLGLYKNFAWDNQCSKFNQYNFFYGWNYSGKTTLSRIFKCLEDKKCHPDYSEMKFSIVADIVADNDILTQNDIGKNYPIRVFNEDFVKENFEWNNEQKEIEPVLILGEESIYLENSLKNFESNKKEKTNEREKKGVEKSKKDQELQKSQTDKASEIRSILNITNPKDFDKTKLENKIDEIKDNYNQFILAEDDYLKEKEKLNEEVKEEINLNVIKYNLEEFTKKINNILQKKISVQKIIEKLKENQKLSAWVRQGIDLHQNEKYCQFCGNLLPENRLENLQQHFSIEYDNLIQEIDGLEKEINNFFENFKNFILPDSARFFKEFQSEYQNLVQKFNDEKKNFIDLKPVLLNELNRKREKPFDVLSLNIDNNQFQGAAEELNNRIKEIQLIIGKHNDKVNKLETIKKETKEKIIKHLVAKFIKDTNYFVKREEIKKLGKEINKLGTEIESINKEITNVNNQIKQSTIGVQKLNEYLESFFSDDKLKIELTENGKYKLYRNDSIAKNLSTGERNIISLIYFFAKLEETTFDKGNAIIFIDDPVSSLDSNHIHRINSLLTKKLPNFGQVFITTHNYDFYNLLKDSCKNDLGNQKGNFYFIKKIKENGDYKSIIEDLPKTLLKFKSEYNYLFSVLLQFLSDKDNFDQLFLMPNILRRFFEMYLFIRYPDGEIYKKKADKFFNNDYLSEKHTALKIMDEYSHEQNPEHATKFPDIQELGESINFILNKIKKNDETHYNALIMSLELSPCAGQNHP